MITRKRILLLMVILLTLPLFAAPAQAQCLVPVRFQGMGGASLTMLNDQAVMHTNPAALAFLEAKATGNQLFNLRLDLDPVSWRHLSFYRRRSRQFKNTLDGSTPPAWFLSEIGSHSGSDCRKAGQVMLIEGVRRGFGFSIATSLEQTIELSTTGSTLPEFAVDNLGGVYGEVAYATNVPYSTVESPFALGISFRYKYQRTVQPEISSGERYNRQIFPGSLTKILASAEFTQELTADVAVFGKPLPRLATTLVLRNTIGWSDEQNPKPSIDAGVGYTPALDARFGSLNTAAEVWDISDNRGDIQHFHLGVEWLYGRLGLRLGLSGSYPTLGLGLYAGPLTIEWAWLDSRMLDPLLVPRRHITALQVRL